MKLFLTAIALAAVAAGVYVFLREPAPGEATANAGSAPIEGRPAAGAELVDPRATAERRAELERPITTPPAAATPAAETAPGSAPVTTGPAVVDPGIQVAPAAVPADDAEDSDIAQRYAQASGPERRQALEAIGLAYKDAAAGNTKLPPEGLAAMEREMRWLEGHLDP